MKHSFGFLTAVVLAWALPAVSVRSADIAPAPAVVATSTAVAQPWFDSVAAPAVMAEPFWFRLALDLHAALMAGKLDGANFLKTLPPDSAPRVLFLSWQSDPAKPAVVVFAAGKGVRAAAANALQKAFVSGAGKPVTGLKVDVVQHRLNLGLFLRSTPLPLPGLIGLAFVPTAVDTAFLPEELLYGDLLTPARFLDVYAVTSGLQGAKDQARLEAWRPISVSRMPAPVSFFETYALYTDGTAVQPMFRGHLLPEPATVKSLRLAAGESAGFLRRNWGQTGVFAVPGWISGLGDHETAADLAAATLALLDWNALAPEAATADTAQRAVRSLQERLKPMACEPGALMVAEEFHTALDANALTVLVLCRAAAASGTPAAFTDSLMRLGAHLLRQVQPDGTFAGDRYYPSGNIRPTPAARETAAMAVTALVALYEQTGQRAFLDQAGKSLRILIEDASRTRGGVDMPPPPPGWLLVAINAYYTFDRDPTLLTAVERLSLAIRLTQVMDPVFPDGLGGFDNGQAVGAASSRVLGLLAAADLLGDSKKRAAVADSTLSAAHLGLLYLRQSQFDAAAAMYLADPAVCRGAFRLGLSGTVMTLRAQADGLMCLTAATRLALKSGETRPLPLADSARRVLARAREQVATFPRCLPPTVPEENTVPIEELTKPGPAPTTTLIKGEPRPTRAPRPTGK